jgi:hypothetical protein
MDGARNRFYHSIYNFANINVLKLFLKSQNLNSKMTWATGHGGGVDHKATVLSRAGFQQENIQRRNM